MHVIPHVGGRCARFAPNPQQIKPSVAHFPWAGKLRATANGLIQSIEIIGVLSAIAAQPDDGYTMPLVAT
jgi:hypothetical protein